MITTQNTAVIRREQSSAEILRWAMKVRLAFFGAIVALALPLRLSGVLSPTPVTEFVGGLRAVVVIGAAIIIGYAALALILRAHLARTDRAGPAVIGVTVAADIVLIFGLVFLVAAPEHYERSLLICFFLLQLVQQHFGLRAGYLALAGIVAAYVALVVLGRAAGAALSWPEELWTLTVFALGAAVAIRLQGTVSARLGNLVRLFERAEDGDFSHAYDELSDIRPDAITTVGRAYNRLRTHLAEIVLTDPLSGCLNRRGFEQQLTRALAHASRLEHEVSLLALDVDFFKAINDTLGHLAGDAVIRELGALLRHGARQSDLIARTGGEEFSVLAPDTNDRGAMLLAERLSEAVRSHQFPALRGRMKVTVSVGVVTERPKDASVAEDLRARADEALYAAKRAGRNRVVAWSSALRELRTSGGMMTPTPQALRRTGETGAPKV